MALLTYDNLVTSLLKWGKRKDAEVKRLIPDFIFLAETEMYNNEGWQLETRDMETIIVSTTTGKLISLPDGFEKFRSIKLETGGGLCDVKFQAPQQLRSQPATGQPRFFTIIGNQIEFERTPDSVYNIQFQYYKKPDPITETNQTNSVLTDHPNIYLYGALHQLFLWAEDDDEMTKYFAKMQSAIRGANKAAKKARYGPAPSMSTKVTVP